MIGLLKSYEYSYIQEAFKALSKELLLDQGSKTAEILSGGNKRKLCTALALFTSPRLLFLDEPTVGLDPMARRALLTAVKRDKSKSVLFTTHLIDEAEYLCDTVAFLIGGRLVCQGSPDFVKRAYADSYLILISLERANLQQVLSSL